MALGLEGDGCECVVSNEVCDGMDNDCDGSTDEGALTDACPVQDGVCFGTLAACVDAEEVCTEDLYETMAMSELLTFEGVGALEVVCDGQDGNCDGRVDENCCPLGDPLVDSFERIAAGAAGAEQTAAAVVAGGGVVLTLWFENVAGVEGFSLWAEVQDPLGTSRTRRRLLSAATGRGPNLSAAWDGLGFGFVYRQGNVVLWQRIGVDGETLAGPMALDANGDGELARAESPIIASFGLGGQFMLQWGEIGSTPRLYVRSYTSTGTPSGAPVELSRANFALDGRLIPLGTGNGVLAIWVDADDEPFRLRWQTLGGSLEPGPVGDIEYTGGFQVAPSGDRWVLVYSRPVEVQPDVSEERLFYGTIDANGVLSEVSSWDNTLGGEVADQAPIRVLPQDDQLVLFWREDWASGGDNSALLSRIIDVQGTAIDEPIEFLNSQDSPTLSNPINFYVEELVDGGFFGFVLGASIDDVFYLGRLNGDSDFMCFSP